MQYHILFGHLSNKLRSNGTIWLLIFSDINRNTPQQQSQIKHVTAKIIFVFVLTAKMSNQSSNCEKHPIDTDSVCSPRLPQCKAGLRHVHFPARGTKLNETKNMSFFFKSKLSSQQQWGASQRLIDSRAWHLSSFLFSWTITYQAECCYDHITCSL